MIDNEVKREAVSACWGVEISPTFDSNKQSITPRDFVTGAILGSNAICVKREFFVDMDKFFDPEYDYDFANLAEESTDCSRGEEPYARPRGWYRIALKVRGKYPDGDTWLGRDGWRNHSDPGEWPVSYHGTSIDGAKGIIESNYKAGPRAQHGRGVYTTPSLDVAHKYYTREFTSKNGKTYRVIMQNRINPQKRERCEKNHDYFLVPVAAGCSAQEETVIVEGAIRPYGILIQEISRNQQKSAEIRNSWQLVCCHLKS